MSCTQLVSWGLGVAQTLEVTAETAARLICMCLGNRKGSGKSTFAASSRSPSRQCSRLNLQHLTDIGACGTP